MPSARTGKALRGTLLFEEIPSAHRQINGGLHDHTSPEELHGQAIGIRKTVFGLYEALAAAGFLLPEGDHQVPSQEKIPSQHSRLHRPAP